MIERAGREEEGAWNEIKFLVTVSAARGSLEGGSPSDWLICLAAVTGMVNHHTVHDRQCGVLCLIQTGTLARGEPMSLMIITRQLILKC
jgi:hypothetical protein